MKKMVLLLSIALTGCVLQSADETENDEQVIEDNGSDYSNNSVSSDGSGWVDPCPPTILEIPGVNGAPVHYMVIPGLCSEMELYWKWVRPDPPPDQEDPFEETQSQGPDGDY